MKTAWYQAAGSATVVFVRRELPSVTASRTHTPPAPTSRTGITRGTPEAAPTESRTPEPPAPEPLTPAGPAGPPDPEPPAQTPESGPAPVPVPAPAPTARLGPLGLLTLLLGAALPMLDFFIVNVALPGIESDLHTTPAALEMVVAGYAVAYAVLLVLGGRLGDTYGRRRLFLWGVAAFGLTSLACGLAPDAWTLVAARVVQGASSALMLPQVLGTIHATTQGPLRARALALYSATAGVAAVLGQVLGGVLVAADPAGTGWRAVFLVNVPVVALALLFALRSVPDSRSAHPARGDALGTVLLAASLTALLLPLTEGRASGWPMWSVVLLASAPLLARLMYAVELRAELRGGSPLLPPSLLREPGVRQGLALGLPVFVGFSSFMFEIAVTLQQGLRFGALAAGMTLVPMGLAHLAMSLRAPWLAERLGSRALALSALVQGAGLGVIILTSLARWPDLSPVALAPGLALCGLGTGIQMPLYFRIVLAAIPAARAGAGSGLAATTQQACLALGVASLGSLFLALIPGLGMRGALVTVLTVHLCGLASLAVQSLRLPKAVR
ncbi:MFS transporter [Streptomyces sp. HNM0575]|uniref:MFS transporter n=1 Tax=Streptomyces sp. HNM0575 TaxID=2716338 RepID=UPI00145ED957|nr:MFS transporter [Streptomyces sp. HNM0575]NLU71579.1 MFS transporter [Streptomyces sp. HNM0575]